ncbi:MAG: YjbQ family protein [Myxococcales bacterium]|nr:MAG: YjbQ family protein [Myxococcales bacterium]
MIFEFQVRTTEREQFVDVTPLVRQALAESGVEGDGVITVFAPHTTAAVTINENTDPAVPRDILTTLDRLAPYRGDYDHAEGNSDAHIKSSLIGASSRVLFNGGQLLLGPWQGIFFAEFDGPRTRQLVVHVGGTR